MANQRGLRCWEGRHWGPGSIKRASFTRGGNAATVNDEFLEAAGTRLGRTSGFWDERERGWSKRRFFGSAGDAGGANDGFLARAGFRLKQTTVFWDGRGLGGGKKAIFGAAGAAALAHKLIM